ncbi:MAG TPA: hypothetical protein VG756_29070 [Pseudonocardiaceae bacterium]|nr:hypothetical protein [Pseudonocardiaceae bacterium]
MTNEVIAAAAVFAPPAELEPDPEPEDGALVVAAGALADGVDCANPLTVSVVPHPTSPMARANPPATTTA